MFKSMTKFFTPKKADIEQSSPLLKLPQDVLKSSFADHLLTKELGQLSQTCKNLHGLFYENLADRKLLVRTLIIHPKYPMAEKDTDQEIDDESFYANHPHASGLPTIRKC
jgi:hypothetical protein